MQPSHGVALAVGMVSAPKIESSIQTLLTGWLSPDKASAAAYLVMCVLLGIGVLVWWFAAGKPPLTDVLDVSNTQPAPPPPPPPPPPLPASEAH